jgi:predicted nucleic acid-binding protein
VKKFVLDCSVSVAWCFGDQRNSYVDSVLESFTKGYEALVPSIWILETINLLVVSERRGRLAESESAHFFELYSCLPISLERTMENVSAYKSILHLAREHDLSAYDAHYIETALRYGIPLATQDSSLRAACKRSGVPVFRPDD